MNADSEEAEATIAVLPDELGSIERRRFSVTGDMGCNSCANLTEVGTRCNLMPPEVPEGPVAGPAASALPPLEDVNDVDGERPDCRTFCNPGGETAGLATDDDGEKLKEEDDIAEGVATGGAEGKGLKLAEGDVESAADDALEGEDPIAVDMPRAELSDSDLPCVPLLCIDMELERCEPDGTWYDKPGDDADMERDAVGGDKVLTAMVGEA